MVQQPMERRKNSPTRELTPTVITIRAERFTGAKADEAGRDRAAVRPLHPHAHVGLTRIPSKLRLTRMDVLALHLSVGRAHGFAMSDRGRS